MNIQAIICSFVLAVGAVLICVTTRTVDDDGQIKGKTATIVFWIGVALTSIGGLGYIFTIYEIIRRGHDKLANRKLRKLEQQIETRQISETIARRATELRIESLTVTRLEHERF